MTRAGGLIVIAIAAIVSRAASGDAQQVVNSRPNIRSEPPAGFEHLKRDQARHVDVIFGDRVLGRAEIQLLGDEIAFKNPMAVAALVPGLRPADRLVAALQRPLPANGDRLCGTRGPNADERLCGRIEPEIVGVIHDTRRAAVVLFIHEDFLEP